MAFFFCCFFLESCLTVNLSYGGGKLSVFKRVYPSPINLGQIHWYMLAVLCDPGKESKHKCHFIAVLLCSMNLDQWLSPS